MRLKHKGVQVLLQVLAKVIVDYANSDFMSMCELRD